MMSETATGDKEKDSGRWIPEEREFLVSLIARSGLINRLIMNFYLKLDVRGLDRWAHQIQRMKGSRRRVHLYSYWPARILERISAYYIGGSLTAAEQRTFGLICRIEDYKLTRYNALFFGSLTGALFISSGKFVSWLGGLQTVLEAPLNLTSALLYAEGVISILVDIYRVIDSYARRRPHMPFGIFPLAINSTTFLKRLADRLRGRSALP
jgi:hypothetical protein